MGPVEVPEEKVDEVLDFVGPLVAMKAATAAIARMTMIAITVTVRVMALLSEERMAKNAPLRLFTDCICLEGSAWHQSALIPSARKYPLSSWRTETADLRGD
jgi:hypothetical protein